MTVIKKKYYESNWNQKLSGGLQSDFMVCKAEQHFNIWLLRIMVGTRLPELFGPSYLVNKLLSIFLLARNDMKKLLKLECCELNKFGDSIIIKNKNYKIALTHI